MSKLTKIKKWASEKKFEIIECESFDGIAVTIKVSNELSFSVSQKESSLRRNIKGTYNGYAKGVYLAVDKGLRSGYSFQYPTQNDIIEKMEEELKQEENVEFTKLCNVVIKSFDDEDYDEIVNDKPVSHGEAVDIDRMTETLVYNGKMNISDAMYMDGKHSMHLSHLMEIDPNNSIVIDAIDYNDEGTSMVYIKIHVFDSEQQMEYNLITGELSSIAGLEYNEKRLGCDSASFNIYTENGTFQVRTGSDGYYGYVFELNGETLISLYFESHFMNASEFVDKFKIALQAR